MKDVYLSISEKNCFEIWNFRAFSFVRTLQESRQTIPQTRREPAETIPTSTKFESATPDPHGSICHLTYSFRSVFTLCFFLLKYLLETDSHIWRSFWSSRGLVGLNMSNDIFLLLRPPTCILLSKSLWEGWMWSVDIITIRVDTSERRECLKCCMGGEARHDVIPDRSCLSWSEFVSLYNWGLPSRLRCLREPFLVILRLYNRLGEVRKPKLQNMSNGIFSQESHLWSFQTSSGVGIIFAHPL